MSLHSRQNVSDILVLWLHQVDVVLSPAGTYNVDILRSLSAEVMAVNRCVPLHCLYSMIPDFHY